VNDVAVNPFGSSTNFLYISTTGGFSKGTYSGAIFSNDILSGGEPRALAAGLDDAVITFSGGGTLFVDNGGTYVTPTLITDTKILDQVCPNCSSLTSTNVALYKVQTGTIDDSTR